MRRSEQYNPAPAPLPKHPPLLQPPLLLQVATGATNVHQIHQTRPIERHKYLNAMLAPSPIEHQFGPIVTIHDQQSGDIHPSARECGGIRNIRGRNQHHRFFRPFAKRVEHRYQQSGIPLFHKDRPATRSVHLTATPLTKPGLNREIPLRQSGENVDSIALPCLPNARVL